jgi:hypothetical protein
MNPLVPSSRPWRRAALPLALALCALGACSAPAPEAPVATTPAPIEPTPPAPLPPPAPRPLPPDASALSAEDRDYLIGQGLGEPEADLIADLRAHPELIECKGAVGGTPGFHDPEAIRILGRDRAQAGFDDGHTVGSVDLSFTVKRGKIDWDVEKIDCGGGARVADAGVP